MIRRPLLALVLASVSVFAAMAQQPADSCTAEGRSALAGTLAQTIKALNTDDHLAAALAEAQVTISTYRASCANLIFTSDEYGADVVTDPIQFPDGFFRVTLATDDRAMLSFEGLDGDCPFLAMLVSENVGLEDQASARMDSCIGVLDISGQGNWVLTFEPLSGG